MKKVLFLLLAMVSIFAGSPCFAADIDVSAEKLSSEETVRDKDSLITFPETVNSLLAIGEYFDKNYPGALIDNDFSADVSAKFQNLSLQEVYEREDNIRSLIKAYRLIKSIYEDIKAKMLVPEAPPLIVPENEYEKADSGEYIETDDVVVVQNFKKVLSYGGDRRDFDAHAAKLIRDKNQAAGIKSDLEQMNSLVKKLEWRKLPFYGIVYENPFTGSKGMGNWSRNDNLSLRLIAEYSTLNNLNELKGGIHFDVPEGKLILAQNTENLKKPSFTFSGSENLASAEYFSPVALRLKSKDSNDLAVYRGNFTMPLLIRVEDQGKLLKLKVAADFYVCDLEAVCVPQKMQAELNLEPGQGFYSSVNNFITQSFNLLPQKTNQRFRLAKAVVDDGNQKNPSPVLRLEFLIEDEPDNFDVYVEGADNISFKRPRIAVGDGKITARLEPSEAGTLLDGKEFEITARLNMTDYLRQKITAEKASVFDYMPDSLSLGIILLAVLGGLILNFMPCVFPVLSLKLLSLNRFGAVRPENVRRSFVLTISGIFLAFEILIFVLIILKLAGRAVGWGMQFQSPYFLVLMIFSVTLFLSAVWGLISFRTPDWLSRRLHEKGEHDSLMHFLTGILVVFMSTPCTAPYLGTAIGFAMGGSIMDVFVILNAVAFGLSLPYFVVLAYPQLATSMPKPGAWMEKLNFIMGTMLFLTLLWLLSILYAQSGFWVVFRLSLYLLFFLFVLLYRRYSLDSVDTSDYEPEIKNYISRLYRRSILSVLLFVFLFSAVDVIWQFNRVQTERRFAKVELIDYDAISEKIKNGKMVVVAVGADWCLTCKYNEVAVFDNALVENLLKNTGTELIKVDWTEYNPEVLAFMQKFGRQGLPFYVIFSPMMPDGMVLPEVLTEREFSRILKSITN